MNANIESLVSRVKVAAEQAQKEGGAPAEQRAKLERIAAEFESMLMVQVLKDMRKAGKWEDSEEGNDSLGGESLFETIDVELASRLAKAQGFGLSRQLLQQFDAMAPGATPAANMDANMLPLPVGAGLVPEHVASIPAAALGDDKAVARTGAPSPAIAGSFDDADHRGVSGATASQQVTSAYGWRRDPLTGRAKFHKGVDLKAAYGQEIQSAGAGKVVFSGVQGGYGTTVMVEHANGTRTRYAHLSVALVNEGDTVAEGQTLGRAGSSGRSTGPHLHFEVLSQDGRAVDPMSHRVS